MEASPEAPAGRDRSALLGTCIAGGSGVLLFLSLFLNWYEFPASGIVEDVGGPVGDVLGLDVRDYITKSGWEAFEVIDIFCVAAALVAVVRAAVALAGDDDNPSIPGSILTLALGAVALALIVYRMANPPGIGLNRELGLWIGLFSAGGIAYGSFVAMQAGRTDR